MAVLGLFFALPAVVALTAQAGVSGVEDATAVAAFSGHGVLSDR